MFCLNPFDDVNLTANLHVARAPAFAFCVCIFLGIGGVAFADDARTREAIEATEQSQKNHSQKNHCSPVDLQTPWFWSWLTAMC
jgi:hypothetical protein